MKKLLEIFIITFVCWSCSYIPERYLDITEFRIVDRNGSTVASCAELSVVFYKGVSLKDVSDSLGCDNGYGSIMYELLQILDKTERINGVSVNFSRSFKVVFLKNQKQLNIMMKSRDRAYNDDPENLLAFYDDNINSVFVCIETLSLSLLVHEFTHMIQDRMNFKLNESQKEAMAYKAEETYKRIYGMQR